MDFYLYGASDDCMEIESSGGCWESYYGLTVGGVRVHYDFDGDWGIWLEGDIPESWVIKSIRANCSHNVRGKPHYGQFIHIRTPDGECPQVMELDQPEEQNG